MSDYTPTTKEALGAWQAVQLGKPEASAEFYRWLASVKTEAWDEGSTAGYRTAVADMGSITPPRARTQPLPQGDTVTALTFGVVGLPAPQGSKRHVGRGIMIESSKRVGPWREDVRAAALESAAAHNWQPADAATSVTILFYLPRPKGHYGTGRNAGILRPSAPTFPAVMPDVDKLARATLDALTSAAVIHDDSRIVSLGAWKHYADARPPGAEITITHLEVPGGS